MSHRQRGRLATTVPFDMCVVVYVLILFVYHFQRFMLAFDSVFLSLGFWWCGIRAVCGLLLMDGYYMAASASG